MLSIACALMLLGAPQGGAPAEETLPLGLADTIHVLNRDYIAPKAVHPPKLFIAALRAATRAEPSIRWSWQEKNITVVVDSTPLHFAPGDFESVWGLMFSLKDVMKLVAARNLPAARVTERAMVDALLRALGDGHSRVISKDEAPEPAVGLEGKACVFRATLRNELAIQIVVQRDRCPAK